MNIIELLDNLTVECQSITGEPCVLDLSLPAEVVKELSKNCRSIPCSGISIPIPTENPNLSVLHCNGGTVFLTKV